MEVDGELSSEFAVYGSVTDRNGTVSEGTSAVWFNPQLFAVFVGTPRTVFVACLNEDITKCQDTYCNTKFYVSTTVFIITQGNMRAICFD